MHCFEQAAISSVEVVLIGRRPVEGTGMELSALCLGTMTFGTPVREAEAITLVHWSLDHGINFIDTANMYEGYARYVGSPGGVAEVFLGKALRGRRERVVLATKVGMKIGPLDSDRGLAKAHIRREVERSLRRLGTDYIDLYYLHSPDLDTPVAESVQALDALVAEGHIRYWGVSNFGALQVRELLETCDAGGWRRPVAVQPAYSLLNRAIESELLPLCHAERLAVVPYRVLEGGMLTGKYVRGGSVPVGSRLAEKPEWVAPFDDGLAAQLVGLEVEARGLGRTLLGHALLSLLERPGVVSLIVGATRQEQLAEMVSVLLGSRPIEAGGTHAD